MMSIDEGDQHSINQKAIVNAAMSITKSSINNTKDEEMNDSCGTANPASVTAGQNHSAMENVVGNSQGGNCQKSGGGDGNEISEFKINTITA